jgi:thiamine transporter ThiT
MADCDNPIDNGLLYSILALCRIGHGILVFLFQLFFDATVPFLKLGIATLCIHAATLLFFIADIAQSFRRSVGLTRK